MGSAESLKPVPWFRLASGLQQLATPHGCYIQNLDSTIVSQIGSLQLDGVYMSFEIQFQVRPNKHPDLGQPSNLVSAGARRWVGRKNNLPFLVGDSWVAIQDFLPISLQGDCCEQKSLVKQHNSSSTPTHAGMPRR